MPISLYIEIEVFCILVLCYMLFKIGSGIDQIRNQRSFTVVMQLTIIAAGMDALQVGIDGASFFGAAIFNEVFCAAYYVSSIIMAFFMLRFICLVLNRRFWENRNKLILIALPLIVGIALPVASFWTEWIFYVDDFNHFHRGPLYLGYIACNFFYVVFVFVVTILSAFQKANYAERELFLSFCFFGVFSFASVMLQVVAPSLPTTIPGITLAILVVYLTNQSQMVSVDPLTRLNNLNQLNHFLVTRMEIVPECDKLYLFVMDVDCFKKINERYGSLEGDVILMDVARVLKKVCGPRGYFISRTGADNFSVVAELVDDTGAMSLAAEIRTKLLEYSENRPYRISMSIGFASLNEKMVSVPDFIDKARRNHKVVKKSANKNFVLKNA